MFHSCVVDKINEFAYSFVWLSSGVVVVGGGGAVFVCYCFFAF